MPPLNTPNVLPANLKWYALVKVILIFMAISAPAVLFDSWITFYFTILLSLGFPIWVYLALSYRFVTYILSENKLTIHSGIIFKRSLTIPFSTIQNSDCSRGPLSSMFDLSSLKIWTASPSQIRTEGGRSQNRPEGQLWLQTATANSIREFILNGDQPT